MNIDLIMVLKCFNSINYYIFQKFNLYFNLIFFFNNHLILIYFILISLINLPHFILFFQI